MTFSLSLRKPQRVAPRIEEDFPSLPGLFGSEPEPRRAAGTAMARGKSPSRPQGWNPMALRRHASNANALHLRSALSAPSRLAGLDGSPTRPAAPELSVLRQPAREQPAELRAQSHRLQRRSVLRSDEQDLSDAGLPRNPTLCQASEYCSSETHRCTRKDCTLDATLCAADQRCNPTLRACQTLTFVLGQPDEVSNLNLDYGMNRPDMVRLAPDLTTAARPACWWPTPRTVAC